MSFILRILGCGIRSAHLAACDDKTPVMLDRLARTPVHIWQRAWQFELSGMREEALSLYRAAACDDAVPHWALERLRALELITGNLVSSASVARRLADSQNMSDSCLLGAVLLHVHREDDAINLIQDIARQMVEPTPAEITQHDCGNKLERDIQDGAAALRTARYVRAQGYFEKAMYKIELALGTHITWHAALQKQARQAMQIQQVEQSIQSLAALTDTLLKYSARTRLAANLAHELRKKNLRDDLATWATGTHDIDLLLQAEYQRLSQLLNQHWNHAELRYRMGLLAHVTGRPDAAMRHWQSVLKIHPHHMPTVARIAALMISQQKNPADMIAHATHVTPNEIEQHYQLAMRAQNKVSFEQSLAALENGDFMASDGRANIAFSLSVMGLLDEEYCEWKNPVPQKA